MNYKLLALLTAVVLGAAAGCEYLPGGGTASNNNQASQQANTQPSIFAIDGIAIKGFDPVAYFQESKPVEGSSEFEYEWMGATWRFSSAQNRDLFASNPEQYAPKYGGYCAWAVSQGSTASIDPQAWKIVDNQLYLNYSPKIQAKWSKDIPGNIAKADANWPAVLSNWTT